MEQLRLKAMAKVNLGLDVVRKREDGYHEVKMIMQTLYLYDQLFLKKSRKPHLQVFAYIQIYPLSQPTKTTLSIKQ